LTYCPKFQRIRIIVNCREAECRGESFECYPECPSDSRIDRKLGNEHSVMGELYDFAGEIGIDVYPVTLRRNKVSIRGQQKADRAVQMCRIIDYNRTLPFISTRSSGMTDGLDGLVLSG
jgi:hypothetical protein